VTANTIPSNSLTPPIKTTPQSILKIHDNQAIIKPRKHFTQKVMIGIDHRRLTDRGICIQVLPNFVMGKRIPVVYLTW
jgi:hypothetical protein